MKLNWGTGIAAFYILFVLFMGFMIYMTTTQKYELVTENYYEEEIKYQSKIDQKERANNLEGKLFVSIEGENLKINFPKQEGLLEGNVICFRPSDEDKDFSQEISTKEGFYDIPLEKFSKGKYIFKINWEVNKETYYSEKTVIIP